MKSGIHPRYVMAQISCACGNSFVTRSTRPVIKLDICSECHPFFTGKQKLMDTAGRVDRFRKRFAATGGEMIERKPKATAAPKAAASKLKVLSTTPRKTGPRKIEKIVRAPKAKKETKA